MDQLDHTELELLGIYKAAVSPTASDRQANWAAIMAGIERGATSRFVESSSGERRRPARAWALGGVTLAAAAALVLVMSSDFSSSLLRGADTDAPGLLSLQADEAESGAAVTRQEVRRSSRTRGNSATQQAATSVDAPVMPTLVEPPSSPEPTSDEVLVGPQPPPKLQPPTQTRSVARKHEAAPLDPMEQLRQEAALIAKAREHLAAGRAGEALRAARGHRRRFAAGTLAEEAALIEVAALCEVGPEPAWRRALERFEDRFPNSPLRVHLRAECF